MKSLRVMGMVSVLCLPLLGCSQGEKASRFGGELDRETATMPVSRVQPDQDTQDQVVEFAERYERRFASRNPLLGTTVDNVTAYDESGDPFELASTRGKHTVLVFGCLT